MSANDLLYAPVNSSDPIVNSTSVYSGDLRMPAAWINVINCLRNRLPSWKETALAGGALRDLDLGRPVKDVDLFMPHGDVTRERLEHCLQPLYADLYVAETKHDPTHNSALSNGVQCPSHFDFYLDGWHFEVTQKMERFTQRSIIDSFDLGICMICLDDYSIYRSPQYLHDVANKHITVVQQTGGRELPHAYRLHRKYSDWTIVQ